MLNNSRNFARGYCCLRKIGSGHFSDKLAQAILRTSHLPSARFGANLMKSWYNEVRHPEKRIYGNLVVVRQFASGNLSLRTPMPRARRSGLPWNGSLGPFLATFVLLAGSLALPIETLAAEGASLSPLLDGANPQQRIQRCLLGPAEVALPNCTAVVRTLDAPDEILAAAFSRRGDLRFEQGELNDALSDYDAALSITPRNATTELKRAVTLGSLGQYRASIESYGRVIGLRPEDARAYNGRGAAYVRLDDAASAIADYDRALALDPKYAEAFNNRGVVLSSLGQLDKAIASFDAALSIVPTYADALNNRAVALIRKGDFAAATDDLGRAIEIRPDYADAFFNRAIALEYLGRHEEARRDYETEKALSAKPRR